MERMLQQPVFALEKNRYRERQSEKYAGCFYYEMLPLQPVWYIPLGGVDWLVNEEDGKVLRLEHLEQPLLLNLAGKQLFGFHLAAKYQQATDAESFSEWLTKCICYKDFAQRCDVCERELYRILPVKNVHVLLQHMLTELIDNPEISVEAIAADRKYSHRQLERLCKEAFGCSPKRLSQMYRICRMLQELGSQRGQTYAELAGRYGYADASHFLRDFKRFMGCNPKHFMEQFLS